MSFPKISEAEKVENYSRFFAYSPRLMMLVQYGSAAVALPALLMQTTSPKGYKAPLVRLSR